MRRRARWLVIPFVLLACAVTDVAAQVVSPVPRQSPVRKPGFFTGYDFHLEAEKITTTDESFAWDAGFGGDVNLVDYGKGRLNFLANYEAILGDEFRSFDVNQGIYTLDFRGTVRAAGGEIGGVFHHVSRHLSDRFKREPVDWNMAGLEYWRRTTFRRARLSIHAQAMWVIEQSFVDYTSQAGGDLRLELPFSPKASFVAKGQFTHVGVDEDVFQRSAQNGGRAEAALRLNGEVGALELFAAIDRRIDPAALRPGVRRWTVIGFRLLSR